MDNLKIENFLNDEASKIEHIEDPKLRAIALLELIEIEYENRKNINPVAAAQKGLVEMFDEMNKMEFFSELFYSIELLKTFQENGNFNLMVIQNDSLTEKLEMIKSLLDSIIFIKTRD